MLQKLSAANLTPATVAGALYLVLWALGIGLSALIDDRLDEEPDHAPAWGFASRVVGLAFALGFLYLMLFSQTFDSVAVGLIPTNWGQVFGWLPVVAGSSILWLLVLWGRVWLGRPPLADQSPQGRYRTIWGLPAHVIGQEARTAILRAAAVPLLGSYWGVWAAVVVKDLVVWLNPATRRDAERPEGRAFRYLDWALDWLTAACFAVSGSIWVSLVVRMSGQLAAGLLHSALFARSRRSARSRRVLPERATRSARAAGSSANAGSQLEPASGFALSDMGDAAES